MIRLKHCFLLLLFTVSALLFYAGCERTATPSGYEENQQADRPDPSITGVEPVDGWLAGIGQVTINGTNFSTVPEENGVFFDGTEAEVVSASPTQLIVSTPKVVGDSVNIRVSVQGAFLYTEPFYYKVETAAEEIGDFKDFENAYGIAVDSAENVFVSLAGRKIVKITPNNEREDYATTTFDKASSMRFGPDGYLYYINILSFMLRVPPGGGADEVFTALPGNVFDLDFDTFGNIYAGGGGEAVYRVKNDASHTIAADYTSISIRTLRVYDNFLYVGGRDINTDEQQIWRNPIISADELGPNEAYFNWTDAFGAGSDILTITFAADGDMYVGTNISEAIIIIHPDGTHEPLYPGVLEPDNYAFSWGNGEHLYVNRRNDFTETSTKRVFKVLMLKTGAPYFGRQ